MSSRDILEFFRAPRRFAEERARTTAALWRAALDEVALRAVSAEVFRTAQKEAWRAIADHGVALVLGPPGTGKTFILAWMALAYLELRRRRGLPCRILMTGFTRNSIVHLLNAMRRLSLEHGLGEATFCWVDREQERPQGLSEPVEVRTYSEADSLLDARQLVVGTTSWRQARLIEKLRHPTKDGPTASLFDLVCIDEASQMVVSQGLMCLAGLAGDGRVLVAGDNRQLPPVRTVYEHKVDERRIGGSLYDFLQDARVAEFRLDETFRLNAPLARFPSEHFYDGRYHAVHPERRLSLRAGWAEGLSSWEREALDPERPVCILLHDGPGAGTSNPFEMHLVMRLAALLRERMLPGEGEAVLGSGTFWNERLAIVTPHRAQNAAIRELLKGRGLAEGCVVETVDRIQGRERDAILASYTVADPEFARSEAEFIFSPERFNVTITRARTKLVLVISRRLLDVIPADEEVFDAAQAMREFVFASEERGQVSVRGPDGAEWSVSVRVRRFDESEPLPRLEPPPAPGPAPEPPPALTPRLRELLEQIREISRENKYGNAPAYAIQRRFRYEPSVEELRALCQLGYITLWQVNDSLAARPQDPLRKPIPADIDSVRARIEEVIESTREGTFAPWYLRVRERFDWVGPDGEDQLRPVLDALVREGVVRLNSTSKGLTVDCVREEAAPQEVPAPTEPLEERDFDLLNHLEEREARRINFGVFETWTTPRELVRSLQWGDEEVSSALRRLSEHGWVLLTESGRVRSRTAELAREVRYLKQRFKPGDAPQRPYLVRALRLELKDRDKPVRDVPLSTVQAALLARVGDSPVARRAITGIATMLRTRWKDPDPKLAGFQARALETLLPAWMGRTPGDDAFVITAETGTGKTEAGLLPLMAGAVVDVLGGIRGTRAVLVYPRIRLAANQAQRITGYLAALSRVEGMPLLTLGMQNLDVPMDLDRLNERDKEKGWARGPDGSHGFPFFPCPECGGSPRLWPGKGRDGADRLQCPQCTWEFAGWIGSKAGLRERPPHFFLPVTESLHHWMRNDQYGRLFGDDREYLAPKALLADEIHLYSHLHGAQVGHVLRRLITRTELNRSEHQGSDTRTLAIGMSATLGKPDEIWGSLCGRERVRILRPEDNERQANPRGREYFFFVQPEIESRGKDIAGASTSIQSIMCLAHGMRRRKGDDGGFRGIVFLDSIDKLKRLHADYADAEQVRRLARLRTRLYGADPHTGELRNTCCGAPDACDRFRDGECWLFAATDRRQRTVRGPYQPGRSLAVCQRPVFSGTGGRVDEFVQKSDLVFSTSSLEVGFDDPDMILVYQHYAPLNLASFIQRKGRGGRGTNDRPVTGVTLSAYSARDSWFFRRPAKMLEPSGFEVPLHVENYFVSRGQVIALVLDLAARRQRRSGRVGVDRTLLEEADRWVRATFGEDIYSRLEVDSLGQLWEQALRERRPGKKERDSFLWVPEALFHSINLPLLQVDFLDDQDESKPSPEDVSLAFSECAPGNMTRRFGFSKVHWIPPMPGRQPLQVGEDACRNTFLPVQGGAQELGRQLPEEARALIGPGGLRAEVARPTQLEMQVGGRFRGTEWQSNWVYDADARRVIESDDSTLPTVHHKSQGRLRGFIIVDADSRSAEMRPFSSLGALAHQVEVFRGAAAKGRRTGLRVSRVYWGADARLLLERGRRREEEYVSQMFVHSHDVNLPEESKRRVLLHGYDMETEGIRLRLNRRVLDDFVREELVRMKGLPGEAKWFSGQFLRYLLMSRGSASRGLSPYRVRQVADLMVTAAAFDEFRQTLQELLRRWNPERFAALLQEVYRRHLRQHPMLSERRVKRLRDEVIASPAFEEVLRRAWEDVRPSGNALAGYLRSLAVHGVALRLEQAFVRHGRGDERRVLFHVKLPVQFGSEAEDVITVAEDGNHGDGTTRTFVERLEEALADLRPERLADCPNADEDRLIARLFEREADVARWRSWDPRDEQRLRTLARELGVDLEADAGPFQGVLRLLYDAEEVGGERFELFVLHRELRRLATTLERDMGRQPSAWELVAKVVDRAAAGDPSAPGWSRLLAGYRALQEASLEESLSPEARLADQAYRISARLCVDGCQACLHTGSSLMDDDMAEVTVSRRLLERLALFLRTRG
jgi:hypothetical protein